jgi:hypothetical protein
MRPRTILSRGTVLLFLLDTTTLTTASRVLFGPNEFYLIGAANAAGKSADDPAP